MPEDYAGLIERLEKADGPDREIDLELFRALGMPLPDAFATHKVALEWSEARQAFVYLVPNSDLQVRYDPPHFTSSLDAALSLVERKRPGWDICLSSVKGAARSDWVATIGEPDTFDRMDDGIAVTPALALCLALLRALSAQPA